MLQDVPLRATAGAELLAVRGEALPGGVIGPEHGPGEKRGFQGVPSKKKEKNTHDIMRLKYLF